MCPRSAVLAKEGRIEQMSRRSCLSAALAGCVFCAGALSPAYADQSLLEVNTDIKGPTLDFDWPAIQIGVGSYENGPTGLTIIHFKSRASAAVDVRGGAPGTVNSDGLRNGYGAAFTDAIVFTGGSAYGEEAITAVATGLKDLGLRAGDWNDVAFVPGAVIYDFGPRRLNEIYPDKRLARAALRAMRPGVFPLGAQGAGRMAMQGGYFGCLAHSGQGGAYRQIGSSKIAAFVVVNASGAVTDREGRLVSCNRAASWENLTRTSELLGHLPASLKADWAAPPTEQRTEAGTTRNTTISLVVTNQKLVPWELQRLAVQVHTSMSRGIQPFSTQNDGDTLFAASTQEVENKDLGSVTLGTIASEIMWDAILASVPEQRPFVSLAAPPNIGAAALASYAGTYEFSAPKDVGDMVFGGVGANIAIGEGGAKVLRPIDGGPVARADVVAGDVITHVDGQSLGGLSLGQMIGRLRGPAGSTVRLRLQRKDQAMPLDIAVIREPIRTILKVRVEEGKLVIDAIGGRQAFEFDLGKPIAVIPLSDSTFYVDGRYHTQIVFTKDDSGRVTGAVLNPGPWEQKGLRID
jgi:L-aminopeptidase/D-esterase-like protein